MSRLDATDPAVAEELAGVLRRAVLDWRGALEAGTISTNKRLRRLAFKQVASTGDLALAEQLATQGCDLGERFAGGGNLVDLLLVNGHDLQAGELIERGIDGSQAIVSAASCILPDRTRQLIALRAEVTPLAAAQAGLTGSIESAFAMTDALDNHQRSELATSLSESLDGIERALKRVESGEMGSSMTPTNYREQIERGRKLLEYAKAPLSE